MDHPVIENVAEHRFEMPFADDAIAAAYYLVEGNRLILTHTEVLSDYAGQGLATRLATGTFDLIRQSGRKAVLKCAFMDRFYASHPEYSDIVDG